MKFALVGWVLEWQPTVKNAMQAKAISHGLRVLLCMFTPRASFDMYFIRSIRARNSSTVTDKTINEKFSGNRQAVLLSPENVCQRRELNWLAVGALDVLFLRDPYFISCPRSCDCQG